ncbi:hypothetical protein HDU83_008309 [Entophlyctis luteolus]|nr:hypothetical protein HDU83_008309 [Entophlyctis luteolus]
MLAASPARNPSLGRSLSKSKSKSNSANQGSIATKDTKHADDNRRNPLSLPLSGDVDTDTNMNMRVLSPHSSSICEDVLLPRASCDKSLNNSSSSFISANASDSDPLFAAIVAAASSSTEELLTSASAPQSLLDLSFPSLSSDAPEDLQTATPDHRSSTSTCCGNEFQPDIPVPGVVASEAANAEFAPVCGAESEPAPPAEGSAVFQEAPDSSAATDLSLGRVRALMTRLKLDERQQRRRGNAKQKTRHDPATSAAANTLHPPAVASDSGSESDTIAATLLSPLACSVLATSGAAATPTASLSPLAVAAIQSHISVFQQQLLKSQPKARLSAQEIHHMLAQAVRITPLLPSHTTAVSASTSSVSICSSSEPRQTSSPSPQQPQPQPPPPPQVAVATRIPVPAHMAAKIVTNQALAPPVAIPNAQTVAISAPVEFFGTKANRQLNNKDPPMLTSTPVSKTRAAQLSSFSASLRQPATPDVFFSPLQQFPGSPSPMVTHGVRQRRKPSSAKLRFKNSSPTSSSSGSDSETKLSPSMFFTPSAGTPASNFNKLMLVAGTDEGYGSHGTSTAVNSAASTTPVGTASSSNAAFDGFRESPIVSGNLTPPDMRHTISTAVSTSPASRLGTRPSAPMPPQSSILRSRARRPSAAASNTSSSSGGLAADQNKKAPSSSVPDRTTYSASAEDPLDGDSSSADEKRRLKETVNMLQRLLYEAQRSYETVSHHRSLELEEMKGEIDRLKLIRTGGGSSSGIGGSNADKTGKFGHAAELEHLSDENIRLAKELDAALSMNGKLKAQLDRRVDAFNKLTKVAEEREIKCEEISSLNVITAKLRTDLTASTQLVALLTSEIDSLKHRNFTLKKDFNEIQAMLYEKNSVSGPGSELDGDLSFYDANPDRSRSLKSELESSIAHEPTDDMLRFFHRTSSVSSVTPQRMKSQLQIPTRDSSTQTFSTKTSLVSTESQTHEAIVMTVGTQAGCSEVIEQEAQTEVLQLIDTAIQHEMWQLIDGAAQTDRLNCEHVGVQCDGEAAIETVEVGVQRDADEGTKAVAIETDKIEYVAVAVVTDAVHTTNAGVGTEVVKCVSAGMVTDRVVVTGVAVQTVWSADATVDRGMQTDDVGRAGGGVAVDVFNGGTDIDMRAFDAIQTRAAMADDFEKRIGELQEECSRLANVGTGVDDLEETCALLGQQLVAVQKAVLDNRKQFNLRKHYDAEIEQWIQSLGSNVAHAEEMYSGVREALDSRLFDKESLALRMRELETLKEEYECRLNKLHEALAATEHQKLQGNMIDISMVTLSSHVINDPVAVSEWSEIEENDEAPGTSVRGVADDDASKKVQTGTSMFSSKIMDFSRWHINGGGKRARASWRTIAVYLMVWVFGALVVACMVDVLCGPAQIVADGLPSPMSTMHRGAALVDEALRMVEHLLLAARGGGSSSSSSSRRPSGSRAARDTLKIPL